MKFVYTCIDGNDGYVCDDHYNMIFAINDSEIMEIISHAALDMMISRDPKPEIDLLIAALTNYCNPADALEFIAELFKNETFAIDVVKQNFRSKHDLFLGVVVTSMKLAAHDWQGTIGDGGDYVKSGEIIARMLSRDFNAIERDELRSTSIALIESAFESVATLRAAVSQYAREDLVDLITHRGFKYLYKNACQILGDNG